MLRATLVSVLLLAVASAGVTACKKPRKVVLTKEQHDQISGSVLTEAPTPQVEANVILDGKIRLIGFDVNKTALKAGESFDVIWYWEALEDLGGDWKIFVHLEAPGKKRTVHDHQGVGELLPLKKWKAGQIIKDEQRIRVAKDFPNGVVKLHVGVFDERAWAERQQNVRMKVMNPADVKVKVDKDSRIEAATIKVSGGKAAAKTAPADGKPRRFTAFKPGTLPVIDGKLDDAIWRQVRPTKPFVTPDGRPLDPRQLTQVRVLWDDKNLYVGATLRDDDIYNDKTGRDTTLWEQDVLEIYLDPGSDGKDYVEIQIAPTGEIFDAHFSTHRKPEWPEAAKKLTLSGMVVKLELDGSVNARGDGVTDRRWSVEAAIPFAELPGVDGPPADGTEWAANFYRIDGKTPSRGGFMGAWAPAGGDFHNTKRFGKLAFKASAPPKVARPFGKAGGASGTPAALPKVDLEKARAAAAAAAAAKAAGARSEPAPAAKATDGPSEGPSAGPE